MILLIDKIIFSRGFTLKGRGKKKNCFPSFQSSQAVLYWNLLSKSQKLTKGWKLGKLREPEWKTKAGQNGPGHHRVLCCPPVATWGSWALSCLKVIFTQLTLNCCLDNIPRPCSLRRQQTVALLLWWCEQTSENESGGKQEAFAPYLSAVVDSRYQSRQILLPALTVPGRMKRDCSLWRDPNVDGRAQINKTACNQACEWQLTRYVLLIVILKSE